MNWTVHLGDVQNVLRSLPDQSAQCCVTSPPYWGLRDYGVEGQLGLEATPELYVANMVAVFEEVRRVLKDDGTLWLNLGDSYAGSGKVGNPEAGKQSTNRGSQTVGCLYGKTGDTAREAAVTNVTRLTFPEYGIKAKDLVGIPWMVAFALRSAGWYLRSDIIWSKPNPMPESVQDRPTKAHEYVFLLSKSPRYFYDAAAIREPYAASTLTQFESEYTGQAKKDYASGGVQNPSSIKKRITDKQRGHSRRHAGFNDRWDNMDRSEQQANGANKRSVWTIATQPYADAHFATFPEVLPTTCLLAGSRQGDTVLDTFCGSGTTGAAAIGNGRNFIGIELNPAYRELARKRIGSVAPLLAQEVA